MLRTSQMIHQLVTNELAGAVLGVRMVVTISAAAGWSSAAAA
jgi:hypothetical protein|tara:strand:- start:27950 stop:28075 length:126 start_codon:yes stop_codon:yes gene_type:complete